MVPDGLLGPCGADRGGDGDNRNSETMKGRVHTALDLQCRMHVVGGSAFLFSGSVGENPKK